MIDLHGLVRSLKQQGLQTPCLFRFPDVVSHRIAKLQARPPHDVKGNTHRQACSFLQLHRPCGVLPPTLTSHDILPSQKSQDDTILL